MRGHPLATDGALAVLLPGLPVFYAYSPGWAHAALGAVMCGALVFRRIRPVDRDTVLSILGLAVVIAIIGITNTLSLSVHERTREIGLLRALGLTRRQIRTMLGVEAVLMSVVAAVIGAFVGVAFAWAAVRSLSDLVFAVPWGQIVLCAVAAALLGLLRLRRARTPSRADLPRHRPRHGVISSC